MTHEFDLQRQAIPRADASFALEWSEALARQIAEQDGIGELTEAHWTVIRTLREHFIKYGAPPPLRSACHMSQQGPQCIEDLFHDAREAWHIAGLPEDNPEIVAYL